MPTTTVEHTASWGRRMVALAIDWAACSLVNVLILGPHGYSENPASGWITLGIFLLESALGTALAGGSFGQLLAGVRVMTVDGRALPLLPSLARSILVCVVIPPLIFRPDGRGLHDMAAGSAAFDLKALRSQG
ncbi:MAG: hypothetical protein JWO46_230 [Nocardioidaceae bacterium]|nr:hypothetical protein [Nocardioidaceae bacterium]